MSALEHFHHCGQADHRRRSGYRGRARALKGAWRRGFDAGHHELLGVELPRNPYGPPSSRRPSWRLARAQAWLAGFLDGESCAARVSA